MNVIEITSLDDERVAVFARLTEPQLRNRLEPEKGIFIAESPKVIKRALDAGYEAVSFLMEDKWLTTATSLVHQAGDVPVYTGATDVLKDLTGFRLTRGVLCAMRRPTLPCLDDVLKGATRIAVFEAIVDHTNVGAMFRSAAALNIDAVLVTPTCCDPLYRSAVRVSMGTVFQVPWTRIGESAHDWPDVGIAQLKAMGFTTVALALNDYALRLDDPQLARAEKLAMILGTEGDGLASSTIASCDFVARIPMREGVDSLNVAAASAVAFWELGNRQ